MAQKIKNRSTQGRSQHADKNTALESIGIVFEYIIQNDKDYNKAGTDYGINKMGSNDHAFLLSSARRFAALCLYMRASTCFKKSVMDWPELTVYLSYP
jgi:hypothetical protein